MDRGSCPLRWALLRLLLKVDNDMEFDRFDNRRDDQPLTTEERRWFKSVVQRIAALLALAPGLDELYSSASEDAFTAEDLCIER